MKPLYRTLSFFFLAGSALFADSSTVLPPNTTDPVAEALPILQAKYPDFKELQYKVGDHLSDLIARSGGKISLKAPETALSTVPASGVPITLPDNIFYWRLASFTPEKSWLDTGGQLQQAAPSTVGVILDLRSNSAPDDYAGACQVLGFFTSGDPTLGIHTVVLLGGQYSFHCPIIVLINNHTTGAAEALAACLQADGALVIGRSTAGKMGRFEEQKLTSGQVLRYFVSPVWHLPPDAVFTFPTHHSLAWGQPVAPDIEVTVDDHIEKGALMLIARNRIDEVIQESAERHRMSEASLVQGQDPEWDDYLASLEKKPFLLSLPAIHDVVLVRALDSIKAILVSQRKSLPATQTAAATEATTSVQ